MREQQPAVQPLWLRVRAHGLLLPLLIPVGTMPRSDRPSVAALLGRTQLEPRCAASSVVCHTVSLVQLLLLALCATVPLAATADEMESFVKTDLRRYDGSDESRPIMMAIQGIVFDVSSGANFYSKAGPYNQLVGKDASLAVGLMSLEQADLDAEDDISELDAQGLEDLNTVFYETYVRKYPILGLATDSRAIPPGKIGGEWLTEVRAKQREAGGPASLEESKKEL